MAKELAVTHTGIRSFAESAEDPLNILDSVGFGVLVVHTKSRKVSYVNHAAARVIGHDKAHIIGAICHQYICPSEFGKCPIADLGQAVDNSERILINANGDRIPIIKTVVPIERNGEQYLLESFVDISERRQAEERLKYDSLTGLYNRTFFERELIRLGNKPEPVGVIVCDVDGLKLVNDTLGHDKGNEFLKLASVMVHKPCQEGDCAARLGGDEFVLLLHNRSRYEVELACQTIRQAIAEYNANNPNIALSLSIGDSWHESGKHIHEAFQEADNNMYRQKLHNGLSARSAMLQTLMKALEARDFVTQGHTERVGEFASGLAKHLGLVEPHTTDIWLLAKFHDIGKVGIPDQILFKEGSLTDSERIIMKRHSEIGYRIARSANDISHMADFILKHHERWDGNGYPLGLKGDDIPLECRILSICDAYDAMTNDRPYRKAMSHETAIKELKHCAGTQFDPRLIDHFIELIK